MSEDEKLADEITRLAFIAHNLRPHLLSLSIESKVLADRYPHRSQREIADMIRARCQEMGVPIND